LLDWFDWQLFDISRDKLLDDLGYKHAIDASLVCEIAPISIIHRPLILAVKGPWPCMNPLKQTLKHPNAKLLKMWKGSEAMGIIKEEFNYVD
jgi:hypothetical protein